MVENFAILPCNGLDKGAGLISGQIAIKLCENETNKIICPVFSRIADAKYKKIADEHELLIIDGCATRCASKLAAEKNYKVSKRITITEEAKANNITLNNDLRLQQSENDLITLILDKLKNSEDEPATSADLKHEYNFEYEIFEKDKFIFRVPKNSEVFYNENDCWAWVIGNHARVGVTDFVQQNLSDILYFTPPEMEAEIGQFDAIGEIESSKSVFELISPVSGRVIAINTALEQKPEMINENPYELGWVADLELIDFESDEELLIGFSEYYKKMIKKVEDENA